VSPYQETDPRRAEVPLRDVRRPGQPADRTIPKPRTRPMADRGPDPAPENRTL